jgi:hypothetical protein
MSERVIFRDAFNPFSVRQNVYTLSITFIMDMAVSLLGAIPLFDAKWVLLVACVILYYVGVNIVQFVLVLAFRLIWFADGAVHIEHWALIFIITATVMCVWPLHSISIWVMNVITLYH